MTIRRRSRNMTMAAHTESAMMSAAIMRHRTP
jgi:hypothetical protein